MGFWDKASDALGTGVQLGVRASEREADRQEREKDRAQREEQWKATNKRADAAEARQQEEFDEKKQFKVVTKLFNSAHALYQAGVEANDEGMIRQGAQKLVETYNRYLPNGDETRIIFKKDSANNPVMQAKWDEDENLKGKEVAILSKTGGVMPFKNLDDAFRYAAANLSMDNFTAGVKAAQAKVAELNAKEEPFMGNDGQYYTRRWKMGKGGMPEKSDPIPYTGITKASKEKQDVVETEAILGRKLKPGEVGVKTGLTKAEGASEMAKNYAQADKARAEGKAAQAEAGKGGMSKKQLDEAKQSLDILLRPFVSKGQPVLDPETGEMTQAADNGLKVAGALIDKAKEDPKSLSKEERRNLPHAMRAWEVYKAISTNITKGHITPEQAARMAEGEGGPVNYKDGNWHPVTNGEHKGKEARYNAETKKFEVRARGGASASFDSGEPPEGAQAAPVPENPPAKGGLNPPGAESEATPPRREPTAADENARRAGLVAGHAGVGREKSALENLSAEDLAAAGRAALEVVLSPAKRVMDDYEYQQSRSGR